MPTTGNSRKIRLRDRSVTRSTGELAWNGGESAIGWLIEVRPQLRIRMAEGSLSGAEVN
ncbi:hypothetical protein ACN4EK_03780 [Pantanalinema rosaneae CENA516]